jgi:hypothetical protein
MFRLRDPEPHDEDEHEGWWLDFGPSGRADALVKVTVIGGGAVYARHD